MKPELVGQYAAMRYLAKIKPKKYSLDYLTNRDGFYCKLMEWRVHIIEGFGMWFDYHTIVLKFGERK